MPVSRRERNPTSYQCFELPNGKDHFHFPIRNKDLGLRMAPILIYEATGELPKDLIEAHILPGNFFIPQIMCVKVKPF